ncbi:MAG: preprotein translocase subunit YajC [Cellulosilyticaceae bacterium]
MNVTLGFLTGMGGIMGIVLYMAFFFGIMWLLIIRPQKKRDKETQSMQDSIKVGDSVLLTTGIYGKVVDVINDLFIIELGLNKSVRIPVKRMAVAGVGEPNLSIAKQVVVEEEYDDYEEEEYDDEYEDEE